MSGQSLTVESLKAAVEKFNAPRMYIFCSPEDEVLAWSVVGAHVVSGPYIPAGQFYVQPTTTNPKSAVAEYVFQDVQRVVNAKTAWAFTHR